VGASRDKVMGQIVSPQPEKILKVIYLNGYINSHLFGELKFIQT